MTIHVTDLDSPKRRRTGWGRRAAPRVAPRVPASGIPNASRIARRGVDDMPTPRGGGGTSVPAPPARRPLARASSSCAPSHVAVRRGRWVSCHRGAAGVLTPSRGCLTQHLVPKRMVAVGERERRVRVQALHACRIARGCDHGATPVDGGMSLVRCLRRLLQALVAGKPGLESLDPSVALDAVDLANQMRTGQVVCRRERTP